LIKILLGIFLGGVIEHASAGQQTRRSRRLTPAIILIAQQYVILGGEVPDGLPLGFSDLVLSFLIFHVSFHTVHSKERSPS